MNDASTFDRPEDSTQAGMQSPLPQSAASEEETLEGDLVLLDGPPILSAEASPPARVFAPAVQAAAVAAGGFVAGAAIVGLVHRRHRGGTLERRRAPKRARRRSSGAAAEMIQIVASRSLLVDVHLLGGSAGGR